MIRRDDSQLQVLIGLISWTSPIAALFSTSTLSSILLHIYSTSIADRLAFCKVHERISHSLIFIPFSASGTTSETYSE